MSVFALKRGAAKPTVTVVTVDITGEAVTAYAPILVDGVEYTAATTGIETMTGKTIVFTIYGTSNYPGWLNIDGVEVARSTDKTFYEHEWVIPNGVTAVVINSVYNGASIIGSTNITVTTS